MDLNYSYTESTVKPEPIEVGTNTVYLRKEISEISRSDEQGNNVSYWTYQEAKLSISEFNENANAILVSGQKSGDDNQLIIMGALADLYDVIASPMA